ncbi:circularly permuted type 2 ATP-grasp protein [Labrys monachus]|uniref:Circularly permuted ATP-grasp superfamily protein/putative alpha-E superfamily protein n=1 Tax=Labrys monachus TaxID=217067 RepID=A0ABU0F8W1_9HYPH|nr:circularly permuted type 2 ATP-grasp protein [Labrys monachus]MDQ0391045.1 putative circularly permuted ATP-grasp superfamily protein/putative alpha-E superfamily protein [Labrys monachus]
MLAPSRKPDLGSLLAGYRPLPGSADELMTAAGEIRPHWHPVLAEIAGAKPEDVSQRFAVADRQIKNSGVYYRVYDTPDGRDRPWPLSHVPLVIPGAEWRSIEAGIIQRAQLLEHVLADLYGPATLVREGALPAAVVAGNPDFLRPLVGSVPLGAEHLVVYAADLGRGPDGRWRVLGDRAQAPSGMGYALENRLAISAALPSLYRDMHVERLAGFFQAMRSTLAAKAGRDGSRIGLLTPGPANETYFEHAYLARYLGLLLVEGADLTVQDGIVYVRTIEGLKRIDAIVRRLDADFADPLELNPSSRIGVAGLVQALRRRTIAVANSLGAGLVEAPAMLAFMPALARRFLGTELALPNIATWWCGEEGVLADIERDLGRLAIVPAFGRRIAGLPREGANAVADLDEDGLARLREIVRNDPLEVAAQEMVRLSTMPVWTGEKLEPRPFTLRVYAVSTPQGWEVMRGGFCRVAESADPRAFSMQRGGRSADVWVTSEGPVDHVSLLPLPGKVAIRRRLGHLPSRAADNLFWFGRYLERAEATLRVVRAVSEMAAEADEDVAQATDRLTDLLVAWGAAGAPPPAKAKPVHAAEATEAILRDVLDGREDGGIPALIGAARRTASSIRERLSRDATQAIADLGAMVESDRDLPAADRTDRYLRVLAALSGLSHENMNRMAGWRFMRIGQHLERAVLTCRLARRLAAADASADMLDALLRVTDSRITYRARYLMGTLRLPVLDLVLLDDGNPRSSAFQITRLAEHQNELPRVVGEGEVDPLTRTSRLLRAEIETTAAADIDDRMILSLENRLLALSTDITARYFNQDEARAEITEGLG